MSQIIPKYIHPHVNVVINDNSVTATRTTTSSVVVNPSISITPSSLSLLIGSIQQFNITTRNLTSGDIVTVTIAGNESENTTITNAGLLTIGLDETSTELIITATTSESKLSAGASVTILFPSIVFNPSTITTIIGTATQFNLVKTNLSSTDIITYALTGNISTNTTVNGDTNTIVVAGDETATSLELVASIAKYSISSTLTANVQAVPTIDISPKDLSVARGTTSNMTITTTNIPTGGVLIASTNSSSPTTTFNTDGELKIADTETLNQLTLRVGLQGTSIFGETTVGILTPILTLDPDTATVIAGETQQFTIVKENIPDSITPIITVTGNTSVLTNIDSDGLLTVGLDENADTLTIIASIPAFSLTSRATVTVEEVAPVPTLTITPDTVDVYKERTQQFTVRTENIPVDVIPVITLTGNVSADTTITSNGLLTVGADETATELTVTATIDSLSMTVSATATVKDLPTITLEPSTIVMNPGDVETFIATVEGIDSYILEYTLEGNDSTDSVMNYNILTIASDETASALTVKVNIKEVNVEFTSLVTIQATLELLPVEVDVMKGETQQFTSTMKNAPEGSVVTYTVETPSSVNTTIDTDGLLTVAVDETSTELTVTASILDDTVTDTSTVTILEIPTIVLTPETAELNPAQTQQFTSVVEHLDTPTVVYTVTNTVSAGTSITSNGLLTLGADETATEVTVTATIQGYDISDSSIVTVVPIPDPIISISPTEVDVMKGETEQFTVTMAHVPDGTIATIAITGNTSADTTITTEGLLTVAVDETATELTLTASVESLSISDTSTVTVLEIPTIVLTPETVTVNRGLTQQFTSVVEHLDTPTVVYDITDEVSVDTTIDTNGLLTVGADETATEVTVTATIQGYGIVDTSTVTIVPYPILTLTPETATVTAGLTQQFDYELTNDLTSTATVVYTVTDNVSADTTIDTDGLLTVGADETATEITVTATCEEYTLTDTSLVTIEQPKSIVIEPKNVDVYYGETQQFTVSKINVPDASVITYTVTDNVSADTVITSEGLLTVGADETATEITVTATCAEFSIEDTATVTLSTKPTITLTPETAELNPSNTQQFTSVVTELTDYTVTYGVVNQTSAGTNITSNGLLTVGADEPDGELTVTATIEGYDISDTSTVTIVDIPDPTISISPTTADVYKSTSQQFVVTLAHTPDGTTAVVVVTGNTSVDTTVDNTGLLTVGADETATELILTASVESLSISDTATVTVLDLPTITLTPEAITVAKGDDAQFTSDVQGITTYSLSYELTDNVSADTVITSEGLLTVGADETATEIIVTVSIDGLSVDDMATVTVVEPATLTIDPTTATARVGETISFTVEGTNLPVGEEIVYAVTGDSVDVNTTFDGTSLVISADETSPTLTVTATVESISLVATATVTIVTATIDINPKTAILAPNNTFTFDIVEEHLSAEQVVTAALIGNLSAETTFNKESGVLTVGADETATELTITLSATELTDVSTTVTITQETLFDVVPSVKDMITDSNYKFNIIKGNIPTDAVVVVDMTGNTSSSTTFDNEGNVYIAADEENTTHSITVTVSIPSLMLTKDVTINIIEKTGDMSFDTHSNEVTKASSIDLFLNILEVSDPSLEVGDIEVELIGNTDPNTKIELV